MSKFQAVIREARDRLVSDGWTVEAIRQRGGVPESTWYHAFAGKHAPSPDTIRGLAKALSLDAAELAALAGVQVALSPEGTPLGLMVEAARRAKGWSHREVAAEAQKAGYTLSHTTVWNIERGAQFNVTDDTLAALAHALRGVEGAPSLADLQRAKAETVGLDRVYRLTDEQLAKMTPERWKRIARIIDTMLDEG